MLKMGCTFYQDSEIPCIELNSFYSPISHHCIFRLSKDVIERKKERERLKIEKII